MSKTLIIGYGSPLRGDDGVGWQAAERLAGAVKDAEVLACHQLSPELAEPVSRAESVILLDARAGGTPGDIACEEIKPDRPAAGTWSHDLNPAALLALAKALYGRAPRAWLFSVSGASFGFAQGLSPAVAAALPALVERVQAQSEGGRPGSCKVG